MPKAGKTSARRPGQRRDVAHLRLSRPTASIIGSISLESEPDFSAVAEAAVAAVDGDAEEFSAATS